MYSWYISYIRGISCIPGISCIRGTFHVDEFNIPVTLAVVVR